MTAVCGIVDGNGKIFIGADTCGSNYYSYTVENYKVFTVNDKFIIGVCGVFRIIDLLKYKLDVPLQDTLKGDDDKFMRTAFIDSVMDLFDRNGINKVIDGICTGGNFLVGYNGNLYEILDDYSVLNCPKWGHAIGSGESAARGSLFTTKNNKNSEERIKLALESAEAVVPSVRSPFTILSL